MLKAPDAKEITDDFWGALKEGACNGWVNICPDSCDNCIFDATTDEFKQWLKEALEK